MYRATKLDPPRINESPDQLFKWRQRVFELLNGIQTILASGIESVPVGLITGTDLDTVVGQINAYLTSFQSSISTFGDHSTRHENGGSDEISIAGLSGLSADEQTPLSHGNEKHTSAVGDTSGPASATDNAVVRFDLTTGKLIQDSKITVDDNGKVTKFADIATEGFGNPAILDVVSLTAQTADIGTTNFTNCNVAGLYRVNFSLQDTTADLTAGALTLTLSWTDGAGATTITAMQVLTSVGRTTGVIFVQLASGNITYGVTHTGIFGTAVYALHAVVERLN